MMAAGHTSPHRRLERILLGFTIFWTLYIECAIPMGDAEMFERAYDAI